MKLLITKIAILTGCLTMSACVFSDSPQKGGSLTKQDAKKIANPGEDLCDVYNWYGDGECDAFCESPDPDCDIQCDGIPVCPDGFYENQACDSISECHQVSLCGATINCQSELVYCLAGGLSPIVNDCADGYEIVESCETEDCYEIDGYCGGPALYCQGSNNCEGEPSCPAGTYETESCDDSDGDDDSCFEQSLCGNTIYCSDEVYCQNEPACAEGTIRVDQCDDTIDIPCYEQTICGETISCRSVGVCDFELSCGQGYVEIESCPTDVNCYEETACGKTISCIEGTANCLAYPSCPAGTEEVDYCITNAPCPTVTLCGVTITCQNIMI